jgi:basic membrane protein A
MYQEVERFLASDSAQTSPARLFVATGSLHGLGSCEIIEFVFNPDSEGGRKMNRLSRVASVLFLTTVVVAGVWSAAEKETGVVPAKMAAVFPGSIQDADYNTLGYIALQEVGNEYELDVAYSEKVAVPDAERAIREYVNAGYGIIWIHGAQFNSAAFKVAEESTDVIFITEGDVKPADPMPNVWYLDRNYYTGFYVLGALATFKSESGKLGYIGGLEIPFTHGEINAVRQAMVDMEKQHGKTATLEYVYVGDFNDPLKTRQAAEGLISKGIDVIISAVNLGNFGLYTAVKQAERPVFITTTYTSKYDQAPDHYLTSDLFDFQVPVSEAVGRTLEGETGGYILLEYGPDKARYIELPIRNVTDETRKRVEQIARDVVAGKIKVRKNLDEILPREAFQ